MTSSYENAFLNHLQADKRIRRQVIQQLAHTITSRYDGNLKITRHSFKHHILKKYRKRWWGFSSARKKSPLKRHKTTEASTQGSDAATFSLTKGDSCPALDTEINKTKGLFSDIDQDDRLFPQRRSLDSAELQNESFCVDFPMSEIGTEMPGNRGNGNSPFNSSNSCASPEGLFSVDNGQRQLAAVKNDQGENYRTCDKCLKELNNNVDQELGSGRETCICRTNDMLVEEPSAGQTVMVPSAKSDDVVATNMEDDEDDDDTEDEDDGEESDEFSGIKSQSLYQRSFSHPSSKGSSNQIVDVTLRSKSPVQYVGSNTSHFGRKPAPISPVKWQQQFMSFLSTVSSPEPVEETPKAANKQSHSPRRKRSRSMRHSTCSCCISPSSKKLSTEEKHHLKRLTRQQKLFIRDMVQLVSLRNKIMKLLKALFPGSMEELEYMNPDTASVDHYIDHLIKVMKTPDNVLFSDELYEQDSDKDLLKSFPDLLQKNDTAESENGNSKTDHPSLTRSLVNTGSQNADLHSEDENQRTSKDLPILDCYAFDTRSTTTETREENMAHPLESAVSHSQQRVGVGDEMESSVCPRLFSEGDSGILPDHDESHYSFNDNSLLNHENHQMNVVTDESKCDMSVSCDSSAKRRARYLGIDVAVVPGAHSLVKKCVNGDSENVLSTSLNHSDDVGMGDEVDNIGHVCRDKESLEDRSQHPAEVLQISDVSLQCLDGGSRQCEQNSSADARGRDGNLPTQQSLFDKIMDTQSGAERSDPFICLSAGILESPKKSQSCAIPSPLFPGDLDQSSHLHTQHSETSLDPQLSHGSAFGTSSYQHVVSHCVASNEADLTSPGDTTPSNVTEVYDLRVQLCQDPKHCLITLKRKVLILLYWLLPHLSLENNFLKNVDNLEYLLDAIVCSNQRPLSVEV